MLYHTCISGHALPVLMHSGWQGRAGQSRLLSGLERELVSSPVVAAPCSLGRHSCATPQPLLCVPQCWLPSPALFAQLWLLHLLRLLLLLRSAPAMHSKGRSGLGPGHEKRPTPQILSHHSVRAC